METPLAQVNWAQATGDYCERAPAKLLKPYIRCLWFHQIAPGQHTAVEVMPDGCIDLLWLHHELRIAGPDTRVMIETLLPGETVIGVRFHPGAALPWLGVPASELINARLPLESLWGARVRILSEQIAMSRSANEAALRLESVLSAMLPRIRPPDRSLQRLVQLVDDPMAAPDSIAALAHELATSERTLRRRCHEAFGYGPKTLARILRFQRFLNLVRRHGVTTLAALAAEAGYSDQAHLCRETRQLSGHPPSVFLRLSGV